MQSNPPPPVRGNIDWLSAPLVAIPPRVFTIAGGITLRPAGKGLVGKIMRRPA